MPAFTIFIDQWPWIAAYALIALGAYMLIFGRKHFGLIKTLFLALIVFTLVSLMLSINGYFERRIEEGPSGVTLFLIIMILLLGVVVGALIGHFMPSSWALVFIGITTGFLISLLIYSFLMSFTGTWIVLVVCFILLTGLCVYLPLKFEQQM